MTESIALATPPPIPPPPLHPRRGGGMIPPHIESIPSLLVIKAHKVVLSVVYHVVLFLACVACSAVRSGRKKGGGLGREYTRGRGGHKY